MKILMFFTQTDPGWRCTPTIPARGRSAYRFAPKGSLRCLAEIKWREPQNISFNADKWKTYLFYMGPFSNLPAVLN